MTSIFIKFKIPDRYSQTRLKGDQIERNYTQRSVVFFSEPDTLGQVFRLVRSVMIILMVILVSPAHLKWPFIRAKKSLQTLVQLCLFAGINLRDRLQMRT